MELNSIRNALGEQHPWKNQIFCFDTITSTNTAARQMAAQGAPHGTVLIADSQTGGRGRMGRSFLSLAGKGIYLSVILRPECPPGQLMHLTCAAAVAMCNAVEEITGLRPGIKWTNDLVHSGKKLGGILTELSLDAKNGCAFAIVGIGINCSHTREDFPPELQSMAASLEMVLERPVDRSALAAAMIRALRHMDSSLICGKKAIMERYRRDCITIGKQVSIHRGDEIFYAEAIGLDDDGALLVRLPDGTAQTVNSGEVSVRGMYGYI